MPKILEPFEKAADYGQYIKQLGSLTTLPSYHSLSKLLIKCKTVVGNCEASWLLAASQDHRFKLHWHPEANQWEAVQFTLLQRPMW